MRFLFSIFIVLALCLFTVSVSAEEIHAPWTPGESWSYDRTTSSYHDLPYNDNCVDFNLPGTADNGRPLLAVHDGQIIEAEWHSILGWKVKIERSDGSYDLYGHLYEDPFVQVQEEVISGQVIGRCGCTGTGCDGSHLHYGHYVNGVSQLITKIDGQDVGQWDYTTSYNTGPIDYRKTTALNNRNPYGWAQSPDAVSGSINLGNIGWWHAYDPNNLYTGNNTAKNCYRVIYNNGNAALVYDALGGARRAYYVGWEKWTIWDNLAVSCGSCPQPAGDNGPSGEGGPNSCLGMPITNVYKFMDNPEIWRQDFQKGLIYNGEIHCYVNCSPGWTSSGWNNQYSYLFADCYDRNGARKDVGNALNTVHTLSGNILIQDFSGGADGAGMIMYDQLNWACNEDAINEAYWVYGNIQYYYSNPGDGLGGGTGRFGCATIDRFYLDGKWCQDFKNSSGDRYRIYDDGTFPLALGTCPNGQFQASGGMSSGGPSSIILTSGPGQMVMKDHLTFSEQNGNTVWFTTHYPVYGSNYSNTDPRVKIYRNGSLITGYKENNRLYITSGYNASYTYEADYPRTIATLTPGSVFNGWRTMFAPTSIIGGTWGNTHNSVVVREYSVGITAYKEFNGLTNLVITEDEYDGGATYTAQYTSISDSTIASKVSLGPGQMVYKEYVHRDFQIGNIVWFRLYYPIYGADYSQTDDRVKLYKNGVEITVHKENVWIYITSGYDATASYEVDYPRARVTLTQSTLFNGWRSLLAPSTVWGATWGNDHASVKVFKDGVQVTAYKEFGSNVLVVQESGYDPNATYTAEYVEVWGTYSAKVASDGEQNEDMGNLPTTFNLSQNYPNPFNPVTTISYSLPEATQVTLDIFNILGQKVETLVDKFQSAGEHTVEWNSGGKATGIYFYRLTAGNAIETKKMVLLK